MSCRESLITRIGTSQKHEEGDHIERRVEELVDEGRKGKKTANVNQD
jgi:hypothetical protein